MEQRGVLKNWNDDKGFGFIQPEKGGEPLFVHISAMRGERRPKTGETVLYLAERGRWRTPENTLHVAELLGGWPGALVAQQLFRHKTRKISYQ